MCKLIDIPSIFTTRSRIIITPPPVQLNSRHGEYEVLSISVEPIGLTHADRRRRFMKLKIWGSPGPERSFKIMLWCPGSSTYVDAGSFPNIKFVNIIKTSIFMTGDMIHLKTTDGLTITIKAGENGNDLVCDLNAHATA